MLLDRLFLVLCSVAVVVAQVDRVASRAVFNGTDTSDKHAEGLAIFQDPKNHPMAVASILFHSAVRNNFLPKQQGIMATHKTYLDFFGHVFEFPGFDHTRNTEETLELTGNTEQFGDEIARKYHPAKNNISESAAAEYQAMIPYILKFLTFHDEQWTLALTSIRNEAGNITVDLSYITLKLSWDRERGAAIKPQTASLRQLVLNVATEYLVLKAENLMEWADNITRIIDFREELTTDLSKEVDALDARPTKKPCRRPFYPFSHSDSASHLCFHAT
ncbi:hypothetical protein B0O80DRAFT_104027 [Mortierella sp. GBAus27b]|nr:hypothetical protein B0O80DRAFT_104027 [Mortierella sp. GBAus27b]